MLPNEYFSRFGVFGDYPLGDGICFHLGRVITVMSFGGGLGETGGHIACWAYKRGRTGFYPGYLRGRSFARKMPSFPQNYLKVVSQNAPDCISAHIHFKKFPGGHAPGTP